MSAEETEQSPSPESDTETAESPAPEPAASPSDEVAKWKALARKHEAQAKANAEAARRLDELENAQKSEQQRLTERAESAEKAAQEANSRLLRAEVAMEKGLPATLAARLTGSTKEELEADAEQLLALVAKPAPGKASDALVGTRTPPAPAEDVEALAARIFAAS